MNFRAQGTVDNRLYCLTDWRGLLYFVIYLFVMKSTHELPSLAVIFVLNFDILSHMSLSYNDL